MEPPTVFVPEEVLEPVQRMLHSWQRLDRGRMLCDLRGAKAGEEIDLSREHVVVPFATKHTVPSLGYVVFERRRKLKTEYQNLSGIEIRDLRYSGVDVTAEMRIPLVAYCGDTAPAGLDEFPAIYEAQILITELTFFRPEHRKEKIHKFGHTHLDDILERAARFKNELLILGHFSTRYHDQQIRKAIEKKLAAAIPCQVELWL